MNQQTQTTATPTNMVGGIGIETGDYFVECQPQGYVIIKSDPHTPIKTFSGNMTATATVTNGPKVMLCECELTKATP